MSNAQHILWDFEIDSHEDDIRESIVKHIRAKDDGVASLPLILAQEIVEDLEAALEQFREIASDLRGERVSPQET